MLTLMPLVKSVKKSVMKPVKSVKKPAAKSPVKSAKKPVKSTKKPVKKSPSSPYNVSNMLSSLRYY